MNLEEKRRAYHANRIRNGMASFVLHTGIIRFGIPLSLVLCLPAIITIRSVVTPAYLLFPLFAVVFALVAVMGGTMYALMTWYTLRRKYNLPPK
jgi:hypothetical protein